MKLIDISPLLSPELPVWPGDEGFRMTHGLSLAQGDPVNATSLQLTAHLGAHADAPRHLFSKGADIASLSLEAFIGPCLVVEVELPPSGLIRPEHLPANLSAPRILFKTRRTPRPAHFEEDFRALAPETSEHLAQSCCLVGIDTPSVDPFVSDLEVHRILLSRGIALLENLELQGVEPGAYTLLALPLRIQGGDGSPVRAVLQRQ